MFPWLPFFVYPEAAADGTRRRGRRRTLQEEFMEVHAISADPPELASSSSESTQLQILCNLKPMATSMRMRLNKLEEKRRRKEGESANGKGENAMAASSAVKPQFVEQMAQNMGVHDNSYNFHEAGDEHEEREKSVGEMPKAVGIEEEEEGLYGHQEGRGQRTAGKMPEGTTILEMRPISTEGEIQVEEGTLEGEAGTIGNEVEERQRADKAREGGKPKLYKNGEEVEDKLKSDSVEQQPSHQAVHEDKSHSNEAGQLFSLQQAVHDVNGISEAIRNDNMDSLLPKAPTEHLQVEFDKDQTESNEHGDSQRADAEASTHPSKAEKGALPKSSKCSTAASTSSSSGQLAPRSGSTGRIAVQKRGTSGSRSGTSSAKHSPRPVHRSTDSIASALKQAEKHAATPPPARRRKSAFETSKAMRELFGGAEESPFAGLESRKKGVEGREGVGAVQGQKEGNKEAEVLGNVAKSLVDGEERRMKDLAENVAGKSADVPMKNGMEIGQKPEVKEIRLERCKPGEEMSISLSLAQPIEAEEQPQAVPVQPANGTFESAQIESEAEEKLTREEKESKTNLELNLEESLEVERRRRIGQTNGTEADSETTEEQQPKEEACQMQPAERIQRSNSRPRSVARVAPFAYFPPEEQISPEESGQTTASAGITSTGRRRVTAHQVLASGAIAELFQQEELDEELLKHPLASSKQNGTAGSRRNPDEDKAWPNEEEKPLKEEKPREAVYCEGQRGKEQKKEQKQQQNGTAGRLPGTERLDNKGARTTNSSSSPRAANHREQQQKPQAPLPGDQQQQQKGGGKGQKGPIQSGRGGGGTGNGNGTVPEGRGSQSTGGGGGGGGGGGAAPTPPSSLDPFKMVNDSANGAGGSGGSSNGMGPQLLIRNAMVLNDDDFFLADVLIEEGVIREISTKPIKSVGPQCEQIEAEGKCLLPAGIDVQSSLPLSSQSAETIGQGTKAALCGGTGTIVELFTPRPMEETGDALLAAFDRAMAQIDAAAECNVALSVAIGKWRGEQTKQDMTRLVERGVNSFQMDLPADADLFEALDHAKAIGALCRVSAENRSMMALLEKRLHNQHISSSGNGQNGMSGKLEAQRVQQLCNLAELVNAPLAIQSANSTAIGQAVQSAKAIIGVEVPVGALAGQPELAEMLASYSNSICTSDQPSSPAAGGKDQIGLAAEKRMATLWKAAVVSGQMDPMRFVAATSANAARQFNLYPRKGRVAVGSDADLVLWDLQASLGSANPARPQMVLLAGRMNKGGGLFLPLTPNSPHLYGLIRLREGNFNFADFRREQQQNAVVSSPTRTGSLHSTRTGTPDEPVAGGTTTTAGRPGSRNRNAQSDQPASRATTKVIQPPGGKSSAFW